MSPELYNDPPEIRPWLATRERDTSLPKQINSSKTANHRKPSTEEDPLANSREVFFAKFRECAPRGRTRLRSRDSARYPKKGAPPREEPWQSLTRREILRIWYGTYGAS